jgi:hypothetical protein
VSTGQIPFSPLISSHFECYLFGFSESESELCSFVSSKQLVLHVLAYAEVLFRWELLHKRIELLKAVDPFLRLPFDPSFDPDQSQLGTPLPFSFLLCVTSGAVT